MASTYDVGTRAWQPDAAEGWVASELVSKDIDGSKAKLVFKLDNGEVDNLIPSITACRV
jgi:myosin-5